MSDSLQAVERSAGRLLLRWKKWEQASEIPLIWLRDHCQCPQCLHPQTLQRQVDTFSLAEVPSLLTANITEGGAGLDLIWDEGNGHLSSFEASFLAEMTGIATFPQPNRILWNEASFNDGLPSVAYDEIMTGDEGLRAWLERIERYGFCLVSNAPAEAAKTKALAERIAYIRETIFGGFWEFTANMAHSDTAYTNLHVGLHTDGTYSHDAPGLQMLHCLYFKGTGAESILLDGFRAAEELKRKAPDAYQLLTEVTIPGQYLESGVHLVSRRAMLRLDNEGELVQVSFNNFDRAPFLVSAERTELFYRALKLWNETLQDPKLAIRFRLEPGEVLVFENWRVLHGRAAYEGERRLCGCYINHEDFESRLRVLRLKNGSPTERKRA